VTYSFGFVEKKLYGAEVELGNWLVVIVLASDDETRLRLSEYRL
jgi:hypothetical protein